MTVLLTVTEYGPGDSAILGMQLCMLIAPSAIG